ncbi:MAG: helix-turn-helix transcriptional regulator [Pleurocapsa sp. SU_196_0]|nr:helix-turn-helix transcriptional regulator [Pleurocapsa sp. SU_196_0]
MRQGSAARRKRGKLELRQQILEAATVLFETQGYEAFSLRQVAEHIGYSPTAILSAFQRQERAVAERRLRGLQNLRGAVAGGVLEHERTRAALAGTG